jgi:hypothetical protein
VEKPVDVWLKVTEEEADVLAGHYWELIAFVMFYSEAGVPVGVVPLILVMDQDATQRVLEGFANIPAPGTYDVSIVIYSWTGAMESETSGSFTIYVWAVEKLPE